MDQGRAPQGSSHHDNRGQPDQPNGAQRRVMVPGEAGYSLFDHDDGIQTVRGIDARSRQILPGLGGLPLQHPPAGPYHPPINSSSSANESLFGGHHGQELLNVLQGRREGPPQNLWAVPRNTDALLPPNAMMPPPMGMYRSPAQMPPQHAPLDQNVFQSNEKRSQQRQVVEQDQSRALMDLLRAATLDDHQHVPGLVKTASSRETGTGRSKEHQKRINNHNQKDRGNEKSSAFPQRQNRWVDIMDHRHDGRRPVCDLDELNGKLLALAEGLSPTQEDRNSWKTAFSFVEKHVLKLCWSKDAQVILFGSTANGLSVRSSNDIDISIQDPAHENDDPDLAAEFIENIGEMMEGLGMRDVLILAHARVPVVKFTYPETRTHVDITVNNTLACHNTKLLADYCAIDSRLAQLVSIVKHWAKQRDVNDPYQGSLSSYCYVLMCIFHLQTRDPPILPVLQELPPTVVKKVGEWNVEYCDDITALAGFGDENSQSLAELLWEFFEYWAWKHDYNNSVISIRTGSILSKESKDWTRRVGRDRHLMCIEDPFLLSHDLGRTVDRQSKDVMRKEFFRAATIIRDFEHPENMLFEKFVPRNR